MDKNSSKILSWLGDFEDKSERDEYLKSKGYDLEELDKRGMNFLGDLISTQKLKQGQRHKELFQRAKELLEERRDEIELGSILESINKSNSQFAYQFSKLEEINEEDVLGMLSDEQLLLIVEELEKEDG